MDAPGFSPESMTGFAAAGAQAMLFTTGAGNSYCSAVAPTLKISARPDTVAHLPNSDRLRREPGVRGTGRSRCGGGSTVRAAARRLLGHAHLGRAARRNERIGSASWESRCNGCQRDDDVWAVSASIFGRCSRSPRCGRLVALWTSNTVPVALTSCGVRGAGRSGARSGARSSTPVISLGRMLISLFTRIGARRAARVADGTEPHTR